MGLLKLIPLPWRIALGAGGFVALALVGILAGWKGYNAGYDKAEALGRAEISTLISVHDRVYAEAVTNLNIKLREQTRRALAASNMLTTERTNNAKEQARLRARIASITANSSHTFSAEFVRLWNEAAGAARGGALPGAGNTPGAAGTPGAGEAADAGLLAAGRVTEADLLAYIIYYGGRCKNLEAQVNAWIDLAEGAGWHEPR